MARGCSANFSALVGCKPLLSECRLLFQSPPHSLGLVHAVLSPYSCPGRTDLPWPAGRLCPNLRLIIPENSTSDPDSRPPCWTNSTHRKWGVQILGTHSHSPSNSPRGLLSCLMSPSLLHPCSPHPFRTISSHTWLSRGHSQITCSLPLPLGTGNTHMHTHTHLCRHAHMRVHTTHICAHIYVYPRPPHTHRETHVHVHTAHVHTHPNHTHTHNTRTHAHGHPSQWSSGARLSPSPLASKAFHSLAPACLYHPTPTERPPRSLQTRLAPAASALVKL